MLGPDTYTIPISHRPNLAMARPVRRTNRTIGTDATRRVTRRHSTPPMERYEMNRENVRMRGMSPWDGLVSW